MPNKKLIFIGALLQEKRYTEITKKNSAVDFACFRCQSTLLEGLKNKYDSITVISAPALTSYPKSSILFFKRQREHIFHNVELINTGYLNLPIIKLLSQCIRVFFELLRLEKDNCDFIIYSPHSAFIIALWPFLRKRKSSSMIIPDLPEFMSGSTNKMYRTIKWVDHKLIDFFSQRLNSFILFSALMTERFKTNNKPVLVMEGVYKEDFEPSPEITDGKQKIILYTGKADARYGINALLDAFSLIEDPDYRLWVRGDGDTITEVKRRSEIDNRIKHIGKLSTKDLFELQQKATVLVNPVGIKEEFTKYFFPSKTLEYLASGTPTIMGRLKCMPPDYEPYVFYYEKDDPVEIMQKIKEVCEMSLDARRKHGQKAREFILTKKNKDHQAELIKKFMNSLG